VTCLALVQQHGATCTARQARLAAETQVRRSLISSKQQSKRFVITNSFIVLAFKIITLCHHQKNIINTVQSE